MARGLSWWWSGDSLLTADTRLSYAQPPGANALQAMPFALFDRERIDLRAQRGWATANQDLLVEFVLAHDYTAARRRIQQGRMVTIAMTLLLGSTLYAFSYVRFGFATGLASLVLCAFHLGVLGHGALFTTDMPVAVASFVAIVAFLAYLERPGLGWTVIAGASLGLAVTMKHSAIVLPFVLFPAGVVFAAAGMGRFAGWRWRRAISKLCVDACVAAVMVIVVVNASYRFQNTGWTVDRLLSAPQHQNRITAEIGRPVIGDTPIAGLPGWLPVPLPHTFLVGLASIKVQAEAGHPAWFAGESYAGGRWYYFPVLLVLKTPFAFLALLAAGAALQLRQWRWPDATLAYVTWISFAVFVLLLLADLNLGVRYALPLVPWMAILAARAAVRIATDDDLPMPGARPVLAAVAVTLCALPAVANYPEYVGSFDPLVGQERGHEISIVGEDWGQDVGELAGVVRAKSYTPLYYELYGRTSGRELTRHGVPFTRITCGRTPAGNGFVAVHAALQARYGHCYPWMARAKLVDHVDHHILIFEYVSE